MKKILLVLVALFCMIGLTSCNKYEEYAGTYELYYMSGDLSVNMYDYYRITLSANGKCLVESKGAGNSQTYESEGTFDIEGDVIKIYTKYGLSTITETYDYINGEIHMVNQSVSGYTFTAKFRRNSQ